MNPSVTPTTGLPPDPWWIRALAIEGTSDPDAVALQGLRRRDPAAPEALARIGSRDPGAPLATARAEELARLALTDRVPEACLRPDRVAGTAALALVWASLSEPEDIAAGAGLYAAVTRAGLMADRDTVHHTVAGQALFLAGRHADLRAHLESSTRIPRWVRHYLTVDLARPAVLGGDDVGADHLRWEALLSEAFTRHGLPAVRVRTGEEQRGSAPFDLLACPEPGPPAHGPLVSVVMPCFRPDETLLTSVRSILGQTWQDLEILLVDDASGPGHAEWFDRAVAEDSRVSLLRLSTNGGSYRARNVAIERARGDFITVQDADDWSHPRRLEDQIRALLADPDAPAGLSRAVRAREDLTHQWVGAAVIRDNASSMMVRREVFERVGPFALVRRSGDSEFAERVRARCGPLLSTRTPLAITRLRAGSLSRADFRHQWMTPERLVFRGGYRAWHARGDACGNLTGPEGAPLPAAVPLTMASEPAPAARAQVALGVAADFSADPDSAACGPAVRGWWQTLSARDAGVRPVGLWHLESPVPSSALRLEAHRRWFDRVWDGAVVPVSRTEPVRVERLVVTDPRVLLGVGAQPCAVRVGRVQIHLDPAVLEPAEPRLPPDLLAVADVCRVWFGVSPSWAPAAHLGEADRARVADAVPGLALAEPWGLPD